MENLKLPSMPCLTALIISFAPLLDSCSTSAPFLEPGLLHPLANTLTKRIHPTRLDQFRLSALEPVLGACLEGCVPAGARPGRSAGETVSK